MKKSHPFFSILFFAATLFFLNTQTLQAMIGNNKVLWIQKHSIITYGGAPGQYILKLSSAPSGNIDFNATVNTSSYSESPIINITNGTHTFTPANWNTPWTFTVSVANNPGPAILNAYTMDVSVSGTYTSGPSSGSSYEDTTPPIGYVYLPAQDTTTVPVLPLGGVLDEGNTSLTITGSFSYSPTCAVFSPIRITHNAVSGTQQVDVTSDHPAAGVTIDIQPVLTTYNTTVAVVDDNIVEGLYMAEGQFTYNTCVSGQPILTIGTNFLITDNDTGVVSITANDATSTENGAPVDNGNFRISLDKANNTGEDLIINYTMSGTASNGVDYTLLSGTATITSGPFSTYVDVPLVPTTDALAEGTEIATMTITSVSGNAASLFSISPVNNAASINIVDNVDTTAPTVTVNQAVGQADPTTTSSINFTAVFSEPIQSVGVFGFTCADVVVTNGICSSIGVLGLTYTITVTASGPGVVSVVIPAGGVKDIAGNLNIASTFTDNSVTYNIPGVPSVVLSSVTSFATEGGATGSYTIALNSVPTANVSITLNSGTQATVSTSTIVFTTTNWNIPRTITVTAIDDTLVEGAHAQTISHVATSADLAYNNVSIQNNIVNITDNDAAPVVSGGGGGGSGIVSGGGAGYVVPNLYYSAPVQTQYLTSTTSSSTTATIQISNRRYDPNKEYAKLIGVLSTDPNVPKEFAPLVCKKLLKSYITLGANNIRDDVQKLQLFLNEKEGENLTVDGIYKKEDVDAVKRFQSKYQEQILLPWGNRYPTGNVNRTTVAKINAVSCADASGSACPYFKNYLKQGDISDDVVKLQDFLNLLSAPTSGYPDVKVKLSRAFGPNTFTAVKDFQATYKDTVLKPWGLKAPSGWFYKTSVLAAHQLMNCDTKISEIYSINQKNLQTQNIPQTTTVSLTATTTATTTTILATTTQSVLVPIKQLPLKVCFEYSENLKRGDKSYEIIVLQQALTYLGFYSGKTSGSFGPETQAAILDFQETYGLQTTGEVGPITAKKINSLACH